MASRLAALPTGSYRSRIPIKRTLLALITVTGPIVIVFLLMTSRALAPADAPAMAIAPEPSEAVALQATTDHMTAQRPPVTGQQLEPEPTPTGNVLSDSADSASDAVTEPDDGESDSELNRSVQLAPTRAAKEDAPTTTEPPRRTLIAGSTYLRVVDEPGITPMKLEAIIWSLQNPVALINGKSVTPNTVLGNVRVVAIESRRIELQHEDVTFYLRLP